MVNVYVWVNVSSSYIDFKIYPKSKISFPTEIYRFATGQLKERTSQFCLTLAAIKKTTSITLENLEECSR